MDIPTSNSTDLSLSHIRTVFFIGIGGVGISALAHFALHKGMTIEGMNDEESPATLGTLRAQGVRIVTKDELSSSPFPEADLYVYSDAWLYRGPEILAQARATGKPVLSYFEALGVFAKDYSVIAVAGVHGKTTTTAMIAGILEDAGLDPTVVVGSIVKKFGSNFKAGTGKYLVVEADEYMRHFLNLFPKISVITNIEADHLDYYKDIGDIKNAFRTFVDQTENTIICDPSSSLVVDVVADKNIRVIDYVQYLPTVPAMLVPGEHNRKDAAAALAVAAFLGIPPEVAQKSIAQFAGTWRRLELRGTTTAGTIVYDDYAHHPTEVKASLQALRELYPRGEKNITVLFQPHLYSRTKALFNDFVTSFDEADNVFLLPIFFAREKLDPTVSSEKLAEAIRLHRGEAVAFTDLAQAQVWLEKMQLGDKDVLVTMGAGEAYKIGDALL